VSWAVDDIEKLGQAQKEVENLGYEQQQKRLAEVAKDSNYRECHPCKVAERVSYKYFGGELIFWQQRHTHEQKWYYKCYWEQVLLVNFWRKIQLQFLCRLQNLTYDDVMKQYEATNNDRLADFNSIYSCVDIDAVGAEYWQHAHVTVVNKPKLDQAES